MFHRSRKSDCEFKLTPVLISNHLFEHEFLAPSSHSLNFNNLIFSAKLNVDRGRK
jgi:hypothetical protein